jgi:hypothetical protein
VQRSSSLVCTCDIYSLQDNSGALVSGGPLLRRCGPAEVTEVGQKTRKVVSVAVCVCTENEGNPVVRALVARQASTEQKTRECCTRLEGLCVRENVGLLDVLTAVSGPHS